MKRTKKEDREMKITINTNHHLKDEQSFIELAKELRLNVVSLQERVYLFIYVVNEYAHILNKKSHKDFIGVPKWVKHIILGKDYYKILLYLQEQGILTNDNNYICSLKHKTTGLTNSFKNVNGKYVYLKHQYANTCKHVLINYKNADIVEYTLTKKTVINAYDLFMKTAKHKSLESKTFKFYIEHQDTVDHLVKSINTEVAYDMDKVYYQIQADNIEHKITTEKAELKLEGVKDSLSIKSSKRFKISRRTGRLYYSGNRMAKYLRYGMQTVTGEQFVYIDSVSEGASNIIAEYPEYFKNSNFERDIYEGTFYEKSWSVIESTCGIQINKYFNPYVDINKQRRDFIKSALQFLLNGNNIVKYTRNLKYEINDFLIESHFKIKLEKTAFNNTITHRVFKRILNLYPELVEFNKNEVTVKDFKNFNSFVACATQQRESDFWLANIALNRYFIDNNIPLTYNFDGIAVPESRVDEVIELIKKENPTKQISIKRYDLSKCAKQLLENEVFEDELNEFYEECEKIMKETTNE